MTMTESAELLSPPFSDQLESIYRDTSLQLIGSIGRGAIMSSYDSYDALPLACRPNGEYRDIDVLDHTGTQSVVSTTATEPLKLDFECNKWVKSEANGVWITFPGDPSIAENVRPEVFEPVARTLGDVACRTYSAATQQRINRLVAFERPKDKQSFREYDNFTASLSDSSGVMEGDEPIPTEFYDPFVRFRQAVNEKHPNYLWTCRAGVVVNSLPQPLRDAAKRLGNPIRRHYLT